MKTKLSVIAALCATSLSPVMVTPAFAAVTVPIEELQAKCAATTVVNPDANSTYSATLNLAGITQSTGAEYVSDVDIITNIPGGELISTVGPTFTGNLGRHGGSPNIFGEFKTVSTYSGGTLVEDVTYSQDTTITYGCIVSKTNSQGKVTTPPGIQVEGLTKTVTTVTRVVHVNESAPDEVITTLSDAVVCNSPEKNPGKWRAQNGYGGECSTALFNTLPGFPIRSNSQPPLVPNDITTANPSSFQDSGPATVVDEWTADETV